MPMQEMDKTVSLLEILKTHPEFGQRDMADELGLSLGMTNLLLKDLVARGWMLMRKLTTHKVQYVLTPEGMKELSRRSYKYIKKSLHHVAVVRSQLETLVAKVQASGATGLWLVGKSGVDFLLEGLCRQKGVTFQAGPQAPHEPEWFVVHGEEEPEEPNLLSYFDAAVVL